MFSRCPARTPERSALHRRMNLKEGASILFAALFKRSFYPSDCLPICYLATRYFRTVAAGLPVCEKGSMGVPSMKRLLLLIASAVFLSILGPLSACAQVPQGAGTDGKSSRVKVHRHWWQHEKHHREKTAPIYTVPKSVGWWHHDPGPAGAGVK
jgi:hypothetical protein